MRDYQHESTGFALCRAGVGAGEKRRPSKDQEGYLDNVGPGCATVLAGGDLIAVAGSDRITILRFGDVGTLPQGRPPEPIAQLATPATVAHLEGGGLRRGYDLLVALTDCTSWRYDLSSLRDPTGKPRIPEPQAVLSAEEDLRFLGPIRSRLIGLSTTSDGRVDLVEIDPRSRRVTRRTPLPFDHVRSVTPLHPSNSEVLVAVDGYGEAHVVDVSNPARVEVAPFPDLDRVSAALIGDNGYLYVARKGGSVAKVAAPTLTATRVGELDRLRRQCASLHRLLKACNCGRCDADGDPTDPDRPTTPTRTDEEPCEERHVATLGFTAARLVQTGQHVLALSASNRRMAVLDQRLNVIFERFLGGRGATVVAADAPSDRVVIVPSGGGTLEAWSIDAYVLKLPGAPAPLDETGSGEVTPPGAEPVTYYGLPSVGTEPNPVLRVAVFNVIEPGQLFTDASQGQVLAQMRPRVFDVVNAYYDENSYNELDVQLSVFGADFGGVRQPLVLPSPAADYFWEEFTSGGVQADMPNDPANPLVLDGTESMTIESHPRVGVGRTYGVPFAALWTARTHPSYPVDINLDGTETLTLDVVDQTGASFALAVTLGALTVSHGQGDDEAAFLQTIGDHVTQAIRAAEAALPGTPTLIQDVIYRRVRLSDDDTEFGRLQGQIRVAPPADPGDATQKGSASLTPGAPVSVGLINLGLTASGLTSGVLDSTATTRTHLSRCLAAAQVDAGEGPGATDPHFNNTPQSSPAVDPLEVTITVELVRQSGGNGAFLEVTATTGLASSGWAAATPLPGSEANADNQSTLRYARRLADDVFTVALDHLRATGPWDRDVAQDMFDDFDVMMIGFIGEPPAAEWGAGDPADFARLRMFRRTHFATDLNNPDAGEDPVTFGSSTIIGQKFDDYRPGLMAHELGHALALPDLYFKTGYRDDVRYIDGWAMMGGGNERLNHFCAWSKWSTGWIVDDPLDANANRVVEVPLPQPAATPPVDAWLVPVEYWDSAMKADVRAEVGGTVPIAQIMKIDLGSDGGVVDLVEFRAPGATYSTQLPAPPAVVCTNVLAPGTDRRWAVNGLYRRSVHQLNDDNDLRAVGDVFNFAAAPEFPVAGTTAEIVEMTSVRGGAIPVARVRVERQDADYVDLYFQDNVPSWRSPDIWVDWPGDNPDPTVPRVYPEGTPTSQGEAVRFPATGIEPHFLLTRVHNGGTVPAEDVEVRWFKCDPPGAGDDSRWVRQDTRTIPQVTNGDWDIMPFDWAVDPATNEHQCIRAEIIDWNIPATVDPATGDTLALGSDDVLLQNNNAQQNVVDFEALGGSPFDVIEFKFQVHNDAREAEVAYLVPSRLPEGMRLTVDPGEATIAPDTAAIFRCQLTLNDQVIRPGCTNDRGFLLTAWRAAHDADEPWGSCFYFVRPRYRTSIELEHASFIKDRIRVHAALRLEATALTSLQPHLPLRARIRALPVGGVDTSPKWVMAGVQSNGSIVADLVYDDNPPDEVDVEAWFDGTDLLGSSRSGPMRYQQVIVR